MHYSDLPNDKRMTRRGAHIMGAFIDALSWESTFSRIATWAVNNESRYICICNANNLIIAQRDASYLKIINDADMATADGMPLAWRLRWNGFKNQQRINGPDLMWRFCSIASNNKLSIFLYGSTPETLSKLKTKLKSHYPRLNIAGDHSPPFRELTTEEDAQAIEMIIQSGAQIIFVGLGCPKQEKWMAEKRGQINGVMIGVGAAFDFHSGMIRRAPVWMQKSGLEWGYRLLSDPRRLWKRYLLGNTFFVLLMIREILRRGNNSSASTTEFFPEDTA